MLSTGWKIFIVIVAIVVIFSAIFFPVYFTQTSGSSSGDTSGSSSTSSLPKKSLDSGTVPAVELGVLPLAPWGACTGFNDPTAQWIWSTPDAASGASANLKTKFQKIYTVPTSQTLNMYVIVDDTSEVFLNGSKIADVTGGWGGAGNKVTLSLVAGDNLIEIVAVNAGGPAGLLVSCYDNPTSIPFHSDKNWVWKLV